MIESEGNWSLAIFYVEESWFILTRALEERLNWGSNYAESIEYWAEDVGRDPTGLFSYYLVSSERTMKDAEEAMVKAGVSIPDLCGNFRKVWLALLQKGKHPRLARGAARECGLRPPAVLRITSATPSPRWRIAGGNADGNARGRRTKVSPGAAAAH